MFVLGGVSQSHEPERVVGTRGIRTRVSDGNPSESQEPESVAGTGAVRPPSRSRYPTLLDPRVGTRAIVWSQHYSSLSQLKEPGSILETS